MRKEFNIKYRPDIEAGRMKVETRDGSPARIIYWNRKGDEPIVALVNDRTILTYNKEGSFVPDEETVFDLFVVETLPISSFEEIFGNYIRAACNYAQAGMEEEIDIHSWAAELLVVAEGIVESVYLSKSKSAKPVREWSEEDKLYVDECINLIKTDLSTASFESNLRRRLEKGLDLIQQFRFQQEQKWSEEDEQIKEHIVNLLANYAQQHNPVTAAFVRRDTDWLENHFKSLPPQPHWKPSKEQMEALMLAIEGKWEAIKPTGYMSRRLEDLYEGLANTFKVDCKLEK